MGTLSPEDLEKVRAIARKWMPPLAWEDVLGTLAFVEALRRTGPGECPRLGEVLAAVHADVCAAFPTADIPATWTLGAWTRWIADAIDLLGIGAEARDAREASLRAFVGQQVGALAPGSLEAMGKAVRAANPLDTDRHALESERKLETRGAMLEYLAEGGKILFLPEAGWKVDVRKLRDRLRPDHEKRARHVSFEGCPDRRAADPAEIALRRLDEAAMAREVEALLREAESRPALQAALGVLLGLHDSQDAAAREAGVSRDAVKRAMPRARELLKEKLGKFRPPE